MTTYDDSWLYDDYDYMEDDLHCLDEDYEYDEDEDEDIMCQYRKDLL